MRRKPSADGSFYMYDVDGQCYFTDWDHLMHNFMQALTKQSLVEGEYGLTCKDPVLPLPKLLRAAIATKDQVVIDCFQRNCDQHAHDVSRYSLTHPGLVKELVAQGEERMAVIIKIIARSCEAWSMPHQTEAARSDALHLLSLLVYRLFGDGINSTQYLGRANLGGVPLKQWLDMLANSDARRHALSSFTDPVRERACEGAFTTRPNEGMFGLEASCNASGEKTDAYTIQKRTVQLDVAFQFKSDAQQEGSSFNARASKRQRKSTDRGPANWNDGTFSRANYDKDQKQRATQHSGGHNNHSTRDFIKGPSGF
jgi:hypothetical protein